MARKKGHTDPNDAPLEGIPPDRAGLPAITSIEGVETFVAPDKQEFKILHTNEVDDYDPRPAPPRSTRRRTPKPKSS